MSGVLLFRWRRPTPPIVLRFRGLDEGAAEVLAPAPDPRPVAAIVGPPGRDGNPGPPGPPGPSDSFFGGFF